MAEDFLNDDAFWKELGLDLEAEDLNRPEDPAAGKILPEPEQTAQKPEEKKPVKKQKKAINGPKKKKTGGKDPTVIGVIAATALKTVVSVVCVVLTLAILGGMLMISGGAASASAGSASDLAIMDKLDMFVTNQTSNALEGILSIKKVYWLSDSDLVAPKPNAANYGTVYSAAEVMPILEKATELIGDQKMIFNEQRPVWAEKGILYYYDETILVITWKEVIDRVVYNMSEVRIAHPSQFRRFLADGEFGSDKLYVTTEMATNVNSVAASSGDYYRFRRLGAVVYDGQLRRFEGKIADTCFITEEGDLLFAYRGDLKTKEDAEKLMEEHGVRFSLVFGPILVDGGKACPPESYGLGEIQEGYARAGLCQVDKLHYLLVSACGEDSYQNRHDIETFAKNLESFGVDKAYALDGGQTTVLTMDGKMYNDVEWGYQRQISDIIYFATAVPEGE